MEKISKQPGQRVKATEVAINNFREWVKFQNYIYLVYLDIHLGMPYP